MDRANAGVRAGHRSEGPPFVFWASLWGLSAAFPTIFVLFEILYGSSEILGRDFVNLWLSGNLLRLGEVATIFDPFAYAEAVRSWFGVGLPLNYSYPPHALLLALPFGLIPYHWALIAWSILGVGLFYASARPYVSFSPVLAVATPAALLCLWFGHYGLILGAAWLYFFRNFGRPGAGAAAAFMTIKPHMGLLIALASLRSRAVLFYSAAFFAVVVGISILVVGLEGWVAFFTKTTQTQRRILLNPADSAFYFRMMPSAFVAYGRGTLGWAMQAFFAGSALYIVFKSKPEPFLYATATFLILPYVFNYDMTVTCLGFAVLLYRFWEQLTLANRIVATLAFLSPALTFLANPLVPPILLGGLLLLHENNGQLRQLLEKRI